MSRFIPGPPEASEYNPAFAGYVVKAQAVADPAADLGNQLDELLSLLRALSSEKRLHRYAPGKWSIQELLAHIIDTERIFAYRALRIARGDETPLPSFDEQLYQASAESERCEWNELLEEFEFVRRANIKLFAHMPDSAWLRTGTVGGARTSVRALAYVMIGHVTHHLDILRQRYL
jgi:uncharacterized damage-inducible protein DinB